MGTAQSIPVPIISEVDNLVSQISSSVEIMANQNADAFRNFATALNTAISPIAEMTPQLVSETGRILSEVGTATENMLLPDPLLAASIAAASYSAVLPSLTGLPNIICDAFRILMSTATIPIDNLSSHLNHATTLEPGNEIRVNIIEYINNSQEDAHSFGIQVKKIIHIERKENQGFRNLLPQGKERMMLYHGTTVNNLCSILRNGLELPSSASTNLLQGRAVYFADRASKSAQYCHERRRPSPGEDGVLLLCDVITGRTHIAETQNHDWTSPPSGFDSVTCPGRRVPSPSEDKNVDGVIFPLGRSANNELHSNCLVEFNEYAIYNTDQIDVKYVIEFTFTPNACHND